MLIQRLKSDQISITISSKVDKFGLERVIDYLKYLEITSNSIAKQSEIDKIADEVNESWWSKNRNRFIQ